MNPKFRYILPTLLALLAAGLVVEVRTASRAIDQIGHEVDATDREASAMEKTVFNRLHKISDAPAQPDKPKVIKMTGAVVFEVDGDPEWVVFVFENGNAYILDTDQCNPQCQTTIRQLDQMGRVKKVDVTTKKPDTET